jgi:hypothetical protein
MIKKIIVSACLLLSLVSFAQEGTSSPYSYYGIEMLDLKGQLKIVLWRGSGRTRQYSYQFTKPASFANLKMTTFCSRRNIYTDTTLKSDN